MVAFESGNNPTWDHTFEIELNAINSSDILTLTLLENCLISDDVLATTAESVKTIKD
jgi:hypothetical protein